MVTELYITPEAIDLSPLPVKVSRPLRRPPEAPKQVERCDDVAEPSAFCRFALSCTRWLVVLALICVGYVSAEAISTGVHAVMQNDHNPSQLLAEFSGK